MTGPNERHHVHGRYCPGGPYISEETVPLTKSEHDALHVSLRRQGLEFPDWPRADIAAHRLRREAVTIGFLVRSVLLEIDDWALELEMAQ